MKYGHCSTENQVPGPLGARSVSPEAARTGHWQAARTVGTQGPDIDSATEAESHL
jgi:hypothetical protein